MSNQEPIKINKNEPIPEGMDFQKLKKEGIDLAQELSGDLWTDYNDHDPGVTILENQVYALTELSYKTSFPVEDYYFSNPTILKDTDHLFYPLQDIMVCSPLTPNDYRKLIIDQISEVKNAWVIPKTQSDTGFDMKGIFQVYIQIEEQTRGEQIIQEVYELLCNNRNLGEDFEKPNLLESKKIGIQSSININSDMIGEVIFANILFKLSELFNPTISFYTMEEMLDKGMAYEEIFQGPLPINGFISDEDLEKSNMDRINKIYRSKIVQTISSIEGVIAVTNLQMVLDNVLISNELLQLENNTYPKLDIELILKNLDLVTLFVGDIPYTLDVDLVSYTFDMLLSKDKQNHKRWLDFKVYEQSSDRDSKDIEFYYSIQNTFPLVYGIGQYGIALKPNLDEYSAFSKQLKAYLTPMDQIMANYLSQLVNIPKLLSIDKNLDKTYFSQSVSTAADMEKIYIYPQEQHEEKLQSLVSEFDKYLPRRNKFLDHLLGRFGEEFLSEAYNAIHRESTALSKEDFSKATIQAKMKFLENYVEISSTRAKGYNYLKPYDNLENTATLKKKVSLMFNIKNYETKKLGNLQLESPKITNTSAVKSGSGNSFTFCSNQENVVAEALAYGTSRLNYDIQFIGKEQYQIYFVHPLIKEKYPIYVGKSLLECEDALKKLIQKFNEINLQCEGFHMIEHVLLRPQFSGGNMMLSNSINHLISAVNEKDIDIWGQKLLNFGIEKKNYRINKIGNAFELQLLDNNGNLIAENKDFSTKKLAENALNECFKLISQAVSKNEKLKNYIIHEVESSIGVNQNEDPYSLKISVLVPVWAGRFLQDKMKTIFENIVRLNAPAHLSIDFYWLSPQQMVDFETLYFKWMDLKFIEKNSLTVDKSAYHLITWLKSMKKPNNKELKKELEKLSSK